MLPSPRLKEEYHVRKNAVIQIPQEKHRAGGEWHSSLHLKKEHYANKNPVHPNRT